MDGISGAYADALTAQFAFVVVDVCQVVNNGDGIKGALLQAFSAADAGHVAGFLSYSSLVLVHARHKNTPSLGAFVAQFDD